MATITKPTTHVDGTIPTAAQFNNNFDTIYNEFNGGISNANVDANAAIAESKISFDTSNGHTHDGVDSTLISLPSDRVRCYLSANQSINNNSWTEVSWNSESYDTNTMHDTSTNPEDITIKTAGLYQVNVQIRWSDISTTGSRGIRVKQNGTIVMNPFLDVSGMSSYQFVECSDSLVFAVNDVITVEVFQDSGSAKNIYGGLTHSCFISVSQIQ